MELPPVGVVLFSGCRVVPCRLTNRRDEAVVTFRNLASALKKNARFVSRSVRPFLTQYQGANCSIGFSGNLLLNFLAHSSYAFRERGSVTVVLYSDTNLRL
jgi:hypothetical protein